MSMRLPDYLPALPENEGNLWTHNTRGEHATKFAATEHYLNPLFQAALVSRDGKPAHEITGA